MDISGALYEYDAGLREEYPLLCGVDEAGRGPLCGPVAAAAVILDPQKPVAGLNDSKKLSEKKREELYDIITATAVCWQVALVPPQEIDRMNILWATMAGMRQAVEGLTRAPDLVLVDGNRCPELSVPARAVVKGDGVSAGVAAASVLAKVTRDRHMAELDRQYPQYQLAKHKGYGTKLHYEMLDAYGPRDFYRQSFLGSWYKRKNCP